MTISGSGDGSATDNIISYAETIGRVIHQGLPAGPAAADSIKTGTLREFFANTGKGGASCS